MRQETLFTGTGSHGIVALNVGSSRDLRDWIGTSSCIELQD